LACAGSEPDSVTGALWSAGLLQLTGQTQHAATIVQKQITLQELFI
jgi:hypothetical protein